MKRITNYLMVLAFMAFTFTSCEDVPTPFGITPPGADDEVITIDPAGSGTQADPYNVQSIIDLISSQDADTPLARELYVKGIVTNIPEGSAGISASYNNATFYISDDADGNNSFYIFRCKGLGGGDITDEGFLKVGDEVVIYGTSWVNYKGNTPQTSQGAAYIYSINGKTADNTEEPSEPAAGDGKGTADSPYNVTAAIAKGDQTGAYVKGFIVGFVDGQAYESGANFSAAATGKTNILIAASADETDAAKCMPVQLPNGDIRTGLNLQDNAGNYKKEVTLYGDITKYFSVPGIKNTSFAIIDGKEIGTNPNGGGNDNPAPMGDAFTLATTISDGEYAIATLTEGNTFATAQALTSGYGYFYVSDATFASNAISPVAANNVFTIKATTGGYTIQDADGQFVYMTGTYNSFNRSADKPADGAVWSITIASDGKASIKNNTTNKTIQYSAQYKSYGAYADVTNTLPNLFKKGGSTGGGNETATGYKATTTIADGKFIIGATVGSSVIVAVPIESSKTYGYLGKAETTPNNGAIDADAANEFTFKAVSGGYTIQSADGRYLYMTGTYNSFNVDAAQKDGYI